MEMPKMERKRPKILDRRMLRDDRGCQMPEWRKHDTYYGIYTRENLIERMQYPDTGTCS